MNIVPWILAAAAAVIAVFVLASYGLYRYALVRPRARRKPKPPSKKWAPLMEQIHQGEAYLDSLEKEQVQICAQDGTPLWGEFYPAADAKSSKVLLAIHGYKTNGKANFSVFAEFFRDLGYALLIPDNRGHGKSGGNFIGFGCLDFKDCLCWMKFIRQRMGNACQIVLHGVSMGAATVLMAAGERPENLAGVIADCGFCSAQDEFRHVLRHYYHLPSFPFLPIANFFCRLRAGYDFAKNSAKEQLKKANAPILFVHGGKDQFVPTWMSEQMYAQYQGPKQLYIAPEADHATSYFMDKQQYQKQVRSFLERFLPAGKR